jgi:hypothetical protein
MTDDGLTVVPLLCRGLSKWWTNVCSLGGVFAHREVIRHAAKRNRDRFKWEFFHSSEVYPLRNYTFVGVLHVAGPANPIPHLNRNYGSWLWGKIPAILPSGQSGVRFGQSWVNKYFTYQHHLV